MGRQATLLVVLMTAAILLVGGVALAKVITGDRGDNKLKGTEKADTIRGKRGDDRLKGFGGPDELYGGRGGDLMNGGEGNDILHSGRGPRGTWPRDVSFGALGDDRFIGGSGDNHFAGGAGDDTLEGQGDDDDLGGGPGDDTLSGGPGDDLLYGCHSFACNSDGDDTLDALDGVQDSVIDCGPGRDTVFYDVGLDPAPIDCEVENPSRP